MPSVRLWNRWSAGLLATCWVAPAAIAENLPAPPQSDPRVLVWEQLESLPSVSPDLASKVDDSASVEVIVERYSNREPKIERHVALDEERNYVNHGPWKMWDPQGRLVAQGHFLHGRMQGKWTRMLPRLSLQPNNFTAPYTSEAEFAQGELHGVWKIKDAQGRPVVSWELQNGSLHGAMTAWYPQGAKKFQTNFRDGLPHGDATYWAPDGRERKKEHYQHGNQRLLSVSWYDSQQKEAEGWVVRKNLNFDVQLQWWQGILTITRDDSKAVNEKTGTWKEWHANGSLRFTGSYREGQPAGKHEWWHPNGQKMMAGDFRNGVPDGRWMRWHVSGRKQEEGSYLAGAKTGNWTVWDETGSVADVQNHAVDEQISTHEPFLPDDPVSIDDQAGPDDELELVPTAESRNVTFPAN